jgi:hypothetical protein
MVTVTGSSFQDGATVRFGAGAGSNVTVVDSATISVEIPPGTGTVDVAVTNPGGQSAVLGGGFTFIDPPVVTAVNPSSGLPGGTAGVVVTGTGFQDGCLVLVDGSSATNVVVDSDTQITCDFPAHAPGQADVTVNNPDSQTGTLENAFSYAGAWYPDATSMTPNDGPTGLVIPVTITGTNFAGPATVTIGGQACTSVTVVDPNTITCDTPSIGAAGAASVVVTNNDLQSDPTPITYTLYDPPTVSSVTPEVPEDRAGPGGMLVTITGTGFQTGATVDVGAAAATNVTVVNATTITCEPPARTPVQGPGQEDVTVTNPNPSTNNSDTLAGGLTFRKVQTWFLDDRADYVLQTVSNVVCPMPGNPGAGNVILGPGQTSGYIEVDVVDGELLPTATRAERALPDRRTYSVAFFQKPYPNATDHGYTFLLGNEYGAALTTDQGATFTTWTMSTTPALRQNYCTAVGIFSGDADPNVFLIGGRFRGAVLTTDGGSSWAQQYDNPSVGGDPVLPFPQNGVQDVAFYDLGRVGGGGGQVVFMIATRGGNDNDRGVVVSFDTGNSWSRTWGDGNMSSGGPGEDTGDTRGVAFYSGGDDGDSYLIACRTIGANTDRGQISRTINDGGGGGGWSTSLKPALLTDVSNDSYITKVAACSQDTSAEFDTWAAGSDNMGLLWTGDNGGTFTLFDTANSRLLSDSVLGISFYNGTSGNAGAHLLIATQAGLTFTPDADQASPTIYTYDGSSSPALPDSQVNGVSYYSGDDTSTATFLVATEQGVRLTTDASDGTGVGSWKEFRPDTRSGTNPIIVNYNWIEVAETFNQSGESDQNIVYQIYDSAGTILPDGAFPGSHQTAYGTNASGMRPVAGKIDLYPLDVSTYPSIQIRATLTDADGSTSPPPSIQTIEISFVYANPN